MNTSYYLNGNPITHAAAEDLMGADRLAEYTQWAKESYGLTNTPGYWVINDPCEAHESLLAGEPMPDNAFFAPNKSFLTIFFDLPA